MRMLCLVAVLGLTACREEGRTMTTFTEAAEQASTSAGDTAVRPAPIIPNPQDTFAVDTPSIGSLATVQLAPTMKVRTTGTATFKANGWSTLASVKLQYGAGGGTHDGYIHQGTCARLGPTVTDLHPVSTDSLGAGRSASYINIPLDSLRAKPHALTFGKGGRPHSCGNIL